MGILRRGHDVVDHLGTPDPADDDYLDYLNGTEPKTEFEQWYEEARAATSTGYARAGSLQIPSILHGPVVAIRVAEARVDITHIEPRTDLGQPTSAWAPRRTKVKITLDGAEYDVDRFTLENHYEEEGHR